MKLSTKWKNWIAILDPKICNPCKANHGKIYEISEKVIPSPHYIHIADVLSKD